MNKKLDEMFKSDFLRLPRPFIRKFNLNTAVMLSEIYSEYTYWKEHDGLQQGGWFFSTIENMYYNTGLSKHQQLTACKELLEYEIIKVKYHGIPKKRYFKFNLAGCFHFTAKRQDTYIDNLRLVYKYFKSCRNCCAHGNRKFSSVAETNYNAIKNFTKDDCGVKELPKVAITKSGEPLKLILRGIVGFYDVLIRIINHYDIVAADKIGIENELIKRWREIPSVKLSPIEKKRNLSIRNYMIRVNMCPSYVTKTNDVYKFLRANHAI